MPRCRPKPVEYEFHVWDGTVEDARRAMEAIPSILWDCVRLPAEPYHDFEVCQTQTGNWYLPQQGWVVVWSHTEILAILTPAEFAEKYETIE